MKQEQSRSGHYEKFGQYEHFVPNALPPIPALVIDNEIMELYGEAMQSLGKWSEAQKRIPGKEQFLEVYIAKEAVFSSQIENINTTLTEVLEYQEKGKGDENKDVREVLNYIEALKHGIDLMRNKNLPVSSRLIRECHQYLLSGVRGDSKAPGSYRKVPVFVGKLVPPPPQYIEDMIHGLEKFINEDISILPLIKTGLAHVQFETIHPFLDGNGRTGRLLIVMMMMDYGLINEPALYPSFYFMKYRSEYYSRLDAVRDKGDYEGWIKFFLRAIKAATDDVVKRALAIEQLMEDYRNIIDNNLGRMAKKANDLLGILKFSTAVSISHVKLISNSSYNTAEKLVSALVDVGILRPMNDNKRGKHYIFKEYLEIIEEEFAG